MLLLNNPKIQALENIFRKIDIFNFYINLPDAPKELILFSRISSANVNLIILLIGFLFILNFICYLFLKFFISIRKLLRIVNLFGLTTLFFLVSFKFYLTISIEKLIGISYREFKNSLYIFKENSIEINFIFSTSFGDSILLLSILVGIICLDILGPKNFFFLINNVSIFLLFQFFVFWMVSTDDLLYMFLSFECIFLPTIYFAYKLGYSKKIDKSAKVLFIWTLSGSFLVLCSISYLYYTYNTTNWLFLSKVNFSKNELIFLFLCIFLGFSVKLPLVPFHYWLLKVHVESPTAFSIFLSGFLVKSAFYCLFMFCSIIQIAEWKIYISICALYSLVIASVGLARQLDIKKLVAWATIQEMSFMTLFLLFKSFFLNNTCILFLILHGLMSSYMFFLVDILQKRFKSRNALFIQGTHLRLPKLTKYIWFLILLFSGFPLTVKFIIEWNLISLSININFLVLIIVCIFVNFLGAIFFCKIMFNILYGTAHKIIEIEENKGEVDYDSLNLTNKEIVILNFLIFIILILTYCIYFF